MTAKLCILVILRPSILTDDRARVVRQTNPQAAKPDLSDNPGAVTRRRTHSKADGKTDRDSLAHIGYARVSTLDQDPALQLDALAAAGCAKVFEDRASGVRTDRAGLQGVLNYVRDGDVLVTWSWMGGYHDLSCGRCRLETLLAL